MKTLLLALAALASFSLPAQACADHICPDAVSTVEITACMSEKRAALDKELQAADEKALKAATALDKTMPDYANVKALNDSRTAFIAYRKAECARRRALATDGSMAGVAELGCHVMLTQQRLKDM